MRKTIYNRLSGIVLFGLLFCGFSIPSIAQGTIILKGDLNNQSGSPYYMGADTFIFSGSSAQTINGECLINNLTLNNAAGLIIGGHTQVNEILTLTNGLVTLGSYNLLLGPSATVAGTPSASNMVVATGSGLLQKQFTDGSGVARSFTYPVGDNTGTAEYSPVTLNFTTGNFTSGIAGVNLVDDKYPDANIITDYLTRYWNLSSSGITGFTCNATFNYIAGASDVVGTEGNIYCLKIAPAPIVTYDIANTGSHSLTANGLTSFSTFTGGRGALETSLTAFLEGPYSGGAMTTNLRTLGLIPLTQPYSGTPWNYSGTESVASIPAGVVDWVLIDLRQANTAATATSGTSVAKRAAFLKSDGTIVDIDGSSSVRFYNAALTNNLYPVILHRNHLSIMSNVAVTRTSGIYTYDFSSAQTQIYDGTGNGCIQLGSKWGMIAANADGNAIVNTTDFTRWQTNFMQTNYNNSDFNMNGIINTTDFTIWQTRFMQTSKVPN